VAQNPANWQWARQHASIHLQIRLDIRPDASHRERLAEGPIVRIFRDDTGQLRVGRRIAFFVALDRDPDRDWHEEPKPGSGQHFPVSRSAMQAARFLEVYLESQDERFGVCRDQVTVLRRSTREPVNPPDSEAYGILEPEDFWNAESPSAVSRWAAIPLAILARLRKGANR
jgi:hypothetical protein